MANINSRQCFHLFIVSRFPLIKHQYLLLKIRQFFVNAYPISHTHLFFRYKKIHNPITTKNTTTIPITPLANPSLCCLSLMCANVCTLSKRPNLFLGLSHKVLLSHPMNDKGVITVRPPKNSDLKDRLGKAALKVERSMNFLAIKAIEEYLKKQKYK